ncbi:hypothetical protein CANCADRAFT_30659 [Tortispora caseinolytica NRRL Y-17796]|uniref:Uncharacterized protein n=1 Tax=Tortispora caseinolytica NRRL Y-17796 TaxID=767744 RepID=A0A1E4TL73_9ASCO|nr:hypothetical protein CANCADRAFT_30659 [Tortispora caseinolytica NRRL Y-17796]
MKGFWGCAGMAKKTILAPQEGEPRHFFFVTTRLGAVLYQDQRTDSGATTAARLHCAPGSPGALGGVPEVALKWRKHHSRAAGGGTPSLLFCDDSPWGRVVSGSKS